MQLSSGCTEMSSQVSRVVFLRWNFLQWNREFSVNLSNMAAWICGDILRGYSVFASLFDSVGW